MHYIMYICTLLSMYSIIPELLYILKQNVMLVTYIVLVRRCFTYVDALNML